MRTLQNFRHQPRQWGVGLIEDGALKSTSRVLHPWSLRQPVMDLVCFYKTEKVETERYLHTGIYHEYFDLIFSFRQKVSQLTMEALEELLVKFEMRSHISHAESRASEHLINSENWWRGREPPESECLGSLYLAMENCSVSSGHVGVRIISNFFNRKENGPMKCRTSVRLKNGEQHRNNLPLAGTSGTSVSKQVWSCAHNRTCSIVRWSKAHLYGYKKRLLLRCIHHFNRILFTIWTICAFRVLNPHQWSFARQWNLKSWKVMIKNCLNKFL